ncbi:hypothetical protein ABEB36_015163 [Hypothenemus hampei]|uniref:Uncharacterized protein n=1 Tax=Hypothenemus hampei TaxID=57062 RepID=A0ABD1E1H3_HYPHA
MEETTPPSEIRPLVPISQKINSQLVFAIAMSTMLYRKNKNKLKMLVFSYKYEEELINDEEMQTEAAFSALSRHDTPSSSSQISISRKRMRSKNSNDLTIEVLQLAGEKLQAIQCYDEFDVFGKYEAHKLG